MKSLTNICKFLEIFAWISQTEKKKQTDGWTVTRSCESTRSTQRDRSGTGTFNLFERCILHWPAVRCKQSALVGPTCESERYSRGWATESRERFNKMFYAFVSRLFTRTLLEGAPARGAFFELKKSKEKCRRENIRDTCFSWFLVEIALLRNCWTFAAESDRST